MTWPQTDRAGFYRLELTGRDAQKHRELFAVNIDPTEGLLRRIDEAGLRRELGDLPGAPVELVRGFGSLAGDEDEVRAELWKPLLFGLIAVLCMEQFLAWSFGRRRQ
jgi:hypothetical protein